MRTRTRVAAQFDAVLATETTDGTLIRRDERTRDRPIERDKRGVSGYLMEGAGPTAWWFLSTAGREVRDDWLCCPWTAAQKLANCGSDCFVDSDGRTVRMGCGHPLCSVCRAAKAAQRATRWRRPVEQLLDAGAAGFLLTLTLPEPELTSPTIILTDAEWAMGYRPLEGVGRTPPGQTGHGSGSSVGNCYGRFKAFLRDTRQAHRGRKLWAQPLGFLYGFESSGVGPWRAPVRSGDGWTGRCRSCGAEAPHKARACRQCGATRVVREHVHVHMLVFFPPEMLQSSVDGHASPVARWARMVRMAWCAETGADLGAQDFKPISSGIEGILETIKYPTKIGERTTASLLSWYAESRGLRQWERGGGLSGASKLGKVITQVYGEEGTLEDPRILALTGDDPSRRALAAWRWQLHAEEENDRARPMVVLLPGVEEDRLEADRNRPGASGGMVEPLAGLSPDADIPSPRVAPTRWAMVTASLVRSLIRRFGALQAVYISRGWRTHGNIERTTARKTVPLWTLARLIYEPWEDMEGALQLAAPRKESEGTTGITPIFEVIPMEIRQ